MFNNKNPVVLVGLVALAVGMYAVDRLKLALKPEPVADPVSPGGKQVDDFLDSMPKPPQLHTLTLVEFQDDGRIWHQLWADGIMVYEDARKDEPFANYKKRLDEQVTIWEQKMMIPALRARAKKDGGLHE